MISIHSKVKDLESKLNAPAPLRFRVNLEFSDDVKHALMEKITGKNDPAGEVYNMVVVGSRGMSNLGSIVVGSVSNFLLNQAPVPVVVVRV